MHRVTAYAVLIFAFIVWRRSRDSGNRTTKQAFDWVLAMTLGQAVLGIGTVLYAVPLGLAVAHQIGAILLWTLIIRARHLARFPQSQSVRT